MDQWVKDNDFDNLILGCTHYPLVAKSLKKLYPQLRLYNSSAEVISEAAEILKERDMLATANSLSDKYYASDVSDNFIAMTDLLCQDRDSRIKLVKMV